MERMELFTQGMRDATVKVYRNALAYGEQIPSAVGTAEGNYPLNGKGHWTDGFWPGLLLLAYHAGEDEALLHAYQRYLPFLEERAENDFSVNKMKHYTNLDHDVGFIFHLTSVYEFLLTGTESSRRTGLKAADSLLQRFHERGSFIRAWDGWEWDTPEFREEKKGKAIVDSLMNMPLLFWAEKETGNRRYREAAERHIRQLRTYIVRKDGSTYHTFNFHPETGEPAGGKTAQGYDDESCWSRGQAWAIYGFALAYRYTQEPETLEAALSCADFWERSLLPQGDAPWDFRAPVHEGLPIDTSAMAVASCGFLELASIREEPRFKDMGLRMVNRLLEAHTSPGFPKSNAFLLSGCVGPAYRKGSAEETRGNYQYADQSLLYGDYFFYEAMLRILGKGATLPWDF